MVCVLHIYFLFYYLYIIPIIYQFYEGTLNKYLVIWNIWASRIIYFRLHKSNSWFLGNWYQWAISWGNVGRVSQCVPCQRDTRGRVEVSINSGGKVPIYSGRPWIHAAGNEMVKTVTSRNYHKTPFLRYIRGGHQVDGW